MTPSLSGHCCGCNVCLCEFVQAPESVSQILKPVVALYAMKVIETNLGWYLSEGLLSTQVGAAVPQHIRYSSMPSSRT